MAGQLPIVLRIGASRADIDPAGADPIADAALPQAWTLRGWTLAGLAHFDRDRLLRLALLPLLVLIVGCGATSIAPPPTLSVAGVSQVRAGATTTFVVSGTALGNGAVVWSAGGAKGGNATTGTISAAGVYTAPSLPPASNVVTISCASVARPSVTGSLSVTILNPLPAIQSGTAVGDGVTLLFDLVGAGFVPTSSVSFDGLAPASTSFLSATHLQATMAQVTFSAASTVAVVSNPSPGAANSNPSTVALPPAPTLAVGGPGEVRVGSLTTFAALTTGLANTAVVWSANGVAGGNAAVGTISAAGVYTAPVTLPAPNLVTIACSSVVKASLTASLAVTLLNPLANLESATAAADGHGNFIVDLNGTGFLAQSSVTFDGLLPATTTYISATHLQATISQIAFTAPITVAVVSNPDPGAGPSNSLDVPLPQPLPNVTAASRLLDQTTFGTTTADTQHVEQIGLAAYLDEQLALPATLVPELANTTSALPAYCNSNFNTCADLTFWQTAFTAPDQLRQRVAFALSEIWVVSDDTIDGRHFAYYSNVLSTDAFGNWRKLMEDVTLSPAMSVYLNMVNSKRPATGQIANENFAREMLQLFSIGLEQLNLDGTPVVDSTGEPVPTDTLAAVQGFAKAYTGWTFPSAEGSPPTTFYSPQVYGYAMQPVAADHDPGAKTLLRGVVLGPGRSAEQDLSDALDNIFADPSLPPFICQQLIRKLVKSNPSPEYVERVSSVFVDDGQGVRGDMAAVMRAIFLDREAREGDDPTVAIASDAGHLREPILWLTAVLRGLGATASTGDAGSYNELDLWSSLMGQLLHRSPSVFNYYTPDYILPNTTTYGPEFEIEDSVTILQKLNVASAIVSNKAGNLLVSLADPKVLRSRGGSKLKVDLSASSRLGQLAGLGPDALLDALNNLFMNGRMPAEMRAAIESAIAGATSTDQAARMAVYLVITSPQYKVEQ